MVKQLVVHDSVTNTCELSELTGYPLVTGGANITVTPTTAANGVVTYAITTAGDTDISANTLTWDAATNEMVSTVTEDAVNYEGRLAFPLIPIDCDQTMFVATATGVNRTLRSMPYFRNPSPHPPFHTVIRDAGTDGILDLDNPASYPTWNAGLGYWTYNDNAVLNIASFGLCAAYMNGTAVIVANPRSAIDQLSFGTVNAEILGVVGYAGPSGFTVFGSRIGGDNIGTAGGATGSTMDGRDSSTFTMLAPMVGGLVTVINQIRVVVAPSSTGLIEIWDYACDFRLVGIIPNR